MGEHRAPWLRGRSLAPTYPGSPQLEWGLKEGQKALSGLEDGCELPQGRCGSSGMTKNHGFGFLAERTRKGERGQ